MNNYISKLEDLIPHKGENKYRAIRILLIKYLFIFFAFSSVNSAFSKYIYLLAFIIALLEFIKFLFLSNKLIYYPSLILNIILSSSYLIFTKNNIYIIVFMLLGEIIYSDIPKKYLFILFHMILFFTAEIILIIKNNSSEALTTTIIIYISVLTFLILLKSQRKDRKKYMLLIKNYKSKI